jgi:colanic acid/amylovoran biosynthesis glycosyltransferase
MSKMRIAFIVTRFPTLSETFILNQITGLLDLGHDVDIYATRRPRTAKRHPDVSAYGLGDRTYYIDMPVQKPWRVLKAIGVMATNFNRSPVRLLRTLNGLKHGKEALSLRLLYGLVPFLGREEAYDILHCQFGPNGNLGMHLREIGVKGKLITTFHGHDTRKALEDGPGAYRELFKKGDCFIAVSEYNRSSLVKLGLDAGKIVYHPVGIDPTRFRRAARQSGTPPGDRMKIVTVARLVEQKGLKYGIHAIRKLLDRCPDLDLTYTIAGGGPLRAQLEKLVNGIGLTEVVRFLGPCTRNEVAEVLAESDLFVLPSVAESFGVVLLEAQAAGLPVVATAVGGTDCAIADGQSGFLVASRDADALTERLCHLVRHPDLRSQMSQAGRALVEQRYDIRKLNSRLVHIYEAVLAGQLTRLDKSYPSSWKRDREVVTVGEDRADRQLALRE